MKILRPFYLNKLIQRMNNTLIKVITGLRRSGKSFLLFNLFKEYLIANVTDEAHVIEIRLDHDQFIELREKSKLKKYIYSKIVDKRNYYVLIDEIQYVKKFEPVLIELMNVENVDLYVTGSNSKFLSTDIDTALNGKNDPIHVYPLSFKEFCSAYNNNYDAWEDYKRYGGLPYTLQLQTAVDKMSYISRTFNELYAKDVVSRYKVRYPEQIDELSKVIASNIGSYTSTNKIVNTIKSKSNLDIKYETICKYLKHLQNAFIFSSCERYELKGRKYIGADKKYYFEDIGIRNSVLNFKELDVSHIIENIIFNELIKHGYYVNVGCVPTTDINKLTGKQQRSQLEIDFVAHRFEQTYLIQVCTSLADPKVLSRELESFKKCKANGEKILLTQDITTAYYNQDGIKIMNIVEFLLTFFEE